MTMNSACGSKENKLMKGFMCSIAYWHSHQETEGGVTEEKKKKQYLIDL